MKLASAHRYADASSNEHYAASGARYYAPASSGEMFPCFWTAAQRRPSLLVNRYSENRWIGLSGDDLNAVGERVPLAEDLFALERAVRIWRRRRQIVALGLQFILKFLDRAVELFIFAFEFLARIVVDHD